MRKLLIFSLLIFAVGCGKQSTDSLVARLSDSDASVRWQAARALGERRSEAGVIVPVLGEALKDKNAYVRRDAAAALGKIGPEAKSAVPALQVALRDRERSVRRAAAEALKKIEPEAATLAGTR